MSARPIAIAVLAAAIAACAPRPDGFSMPRAHAHVRHLAAALGSRPAGSDPNRQARDYLTSQLRASGFEVRVQEADAEWPGQGHSARVSNVVATLGAGDAIALMAHYDSVPDGPGAADDALGAAVCLEAGRVLAARPARRRALVVILTDGEELGLMGAAALLQDPVRRRLRATLNFEAIGSGAPVMLFETGAASDALVETWARHAPHPHGASFMADIYRMISRGGDRTDLGPFRRAGLAGLGFAAVGDGYTYHTPRDSAERLDARALRQAGENAVAIAVALDEDGTSIRKAAASTYFDLLGLTAFAYGTRGEWLVLALAVLAGLAAWARVAAHARRAVPASAVWLTVPWTVACAAAAAGAMLGAAWLLRATRGAVHPWYAHPDRFFVFIAVAGAEAAWLVARSSRLVPVRWRGSALPAVTWVLTLPVWALLAILAARYAAATAFLVEWPLLAASVALLVVPIGRPVAMRAASAAALLAAALFWLPNGFTLLHFAVPELARNPIVTPLFLYPSLLFALGVFLVPPLLALAGRAPARHDREPRAMRRPAIAIGVAAALAGSFAWCWVAPAYTRERPLRHSIRYLADVSNGTAAWEIAGNEPAAVPGMTWRDGPASAALTSAVGPLEGPFVAHAAAPAALAPSVTVTGKVNRATDATLALRVVPGEAGWTIAVVLPAGVVPLAARPATATRRGRHAAVRSAVPAEGFTFEGRFGLSDADALRRVTVVAAASGLPGASWPALPAWLPQERDVWQARRYYLLPIDWR
jgi:hypothetical protein